MKFLFDLFPILLFFITFKVGQNHSESLAGHLEHYIGSGIDPSQAPVLAATIVAIIASVLQVAIVFLRGKKPEPMLWISLVVIVVFGSLTLWLHNEMFIKFKPSILYWIFASILLFGAITDVNYLKKLLGDKIELPEPAWTKLQWAWILFFVLVGFINVAVAFTCSTEAWVNFKLFGLMGLTLLFTIGMGFWIAKITQ